MRSLQYAIACGALLIGTSAQAQDVGVVGDGSAIIQQGAVEAPMGTGQGMLALNGRGGSAESIVTITSDHASFESGVAVSGRQSSAVSYSGVDVTLTNGSDNALSIENFGSTIIPAGMGFYLADRDGIATDNNIFTGFGQTDSGLTFGSLFSQVGNDTVFASAAFDFSIVSNDQTLYSLNGSLDLRFVDGILQMDYGLTDAAGKLQGFTTAYNSDFARAFAWGATDIVVPLNTLLLPGQSQVLEYRTSVSAYTNVDCVATNTACLVAYSGFGDPIGRGGGVQLAAARGFRTQQAYKPITGIVFDPQDIQPFRNIASVPVPEPATWISMLLGFGLLGAALRRRRVLSYS